MIFNAKSTMAVIIIIIIIITNIYIAPLLPKSPQRFTNQHNTQNIHTHASTIYIMLCTIQQKTHHQITQEPRLYERRRRNMMIIIYNNRIE